MNILKTCISGASIVAFSASALANINFSYGVTPSTDAPFFTDSAGNRLGSTDAVMAFGVFTEANPDTFVQNNSNNLSVLSNSFLEISSSKRVHSNTDGWFYGSEGSVVTDSGEFAPAVGLTPYLWVLTGITDTNNIANSTGHLIVQMDSWSGVDFDILSSGAASILTVRDYSISTLDSGPELLVGSFGLDGFSNTLLQAQSISAVPEPAGITLFFGLAATAFCVFGNRRRK